MPSTFRASLPFASLTAVGMLATDLYLPAVPSLTSQLDGSLVQAQATLAVFMIALAISQLVWGWASDRFGEAKAILIGTVLLGGSSVICAIAPNFTVLLMGRIIQGFGAGAATVIVPVLLRKRFDEAGAIRAIGLVAAAESLVPALAPVAGAAIIAFANWRWTFWVIAILTAMLTPIISTILTTDKPITALSSTTSSSYLSVLRNRIFLRYALSYSLMFGALLMFVSSAPQLITMWLHLPVSGFAIMQICGVAAFIVGVASGGKIAQQRSADFVIHAGAWIQGVSSLAFLLLAFAQWRSLTALIFCWVIFCIGLGFRAPSTMARALSVAHRVAGKASGLLMFLAFSLSALATMLVAPLLTQGLLPVAVMLMVLIGTSTVILPPITKAETATETPTQDV